MALITINRHTVQCTGEHAGALALPAGKRRWGRIVALLVLVAGISVAATAAVAGPGGQNTTSVAFTALNPAKKILNATSIAANKTVSAVVIGGSTTVPADATTVELAITVTGTASGDLNFYPAGNVGGGSGQFVEWTAHGTGTGTIQENPGQSDELTFYNVSSAAAKVTATITGYSTQVTAGDVNGSGGTAGQALINNGDGTTSWGSSAPSSYTSITLPQVHFTGLHFVQVASVAVPAGDYDVTYTATVTNAGSAQDTIYCYVNGTVPNDVGQIVEKTDVGGMLTNEIVVQAITRAAVAGSITITCADDNGTSTLGENEFPVMTALQVNAHGVYSNN